MNVRSIRPEEGHILRDLRLRMLADTPSAFYEKLADAQASPESRWIEAAQHFTSSKDETYLVVENGKNACGAVEVQLLEPASLSREQIIILARANNGAVPTATEMEQLGPALTRAAKLMAELGRDNVMGQIGAMLTAGMPFSDVLREGASAFAPVDGYTPQDWDTLILPAQTVFITGMWVDPAYRGQRVGQALLDAAYAWARTKQTRRMILTVTENNAGAIRFYLKAGFIFTGHRFPFPADPSLWVQVMARDF